MEVVKTRYVGFCFGVRRAVELCLKEKASAKGTLYTLGPLIHNEQVVERLKALGIIVEEAAERIEEGTVVLRTHGIRKEEELVLRKKGLRILDATCPLVKRVREHAISLRQEGYKVVIVGREDHPEVKSVLSYLDNDAIVLSQYERIRGRRIGLVAQTTEELGKFANIAKRLIEEGYEVRVFNTVCMVTRLRQREAREISKQVDLVLVLGGKASSNTDKLYNVAKNENPCSYKIETKADIEPEWFKGKRKVGLIAGTSTPGEVVEEVARVVKSL